MYCILIIYTSPHREELRRSAEAVAEVDVYRAKAKLAERLKV